MFVCVWLLSVVVGHLMLSVVFFSALFVTVLSSFLHCSWHRCLLFCIVRDSVVFFSKLFNCLWQCCLLFCIVRDSVVFYSALFVTVTLVVLNCVYMKYVTKIQTFLSGTKMIALLIIVIAGIYQMAIGKTWSLFSLQLQLRVSLLNRPSCFPIDPVGQGTELNWTELNYNIVHG